MPGLRSGDVPVDLHCHVLPGIDDGARDLGDAVAMGWQANADGIEAICATPHIRDDHDVRLDELPARREELSAALLAAGCPVRILAGGEVGAAVVDRLDDAELTQLTLGGAGRWILLEPHPGPIDGRLEHVMASLAARGFSALIAHPERHLGPELPGVLRAAIARGALVQATAACFTDAITASGMRELSEQGLIHVLGSDAHSARAGRPVTLSPALAVLGEIEPAARHITWMSRTAPSGIIGGLEVTPPFAARAR